LGKGQTRKFWKKERHRGRGLRFHFKETSLKWRVEGGERAHKGDTSRSGANTDHQFGLTLPGKTEKNNLSGRKEKIQSEMSVGETRPVKKRVDSGWAEGHGEKIKRKIRKPWFEEKLFLAKKEEEHSREVTKKK